MALLESHLRASAQSEARITDRKISKSILRSAMRGNDRFREAAFLPRLIVSSMES